MNPWIRDYFSFSRKDRIAILVLVTLIFLTLLLPNFFRNAIRTPPGQTDTAWIALVRALVVKQDSEHLVHSGPKWSGNRKFAARYPDSARRWKDWSQSVQNTRPFPEKRFVRKPVPPVDINLADTTAFIALPGIGSKLAERIVKFREKLGGFYSIDQIGEVYGLADSVFQKIRPLFLMAPFLVKKININTVSLDELKAHPYIRFNIARSIISYREQHGAFTAIEDLKKLVLMTDDIYTKAYPYLEL
jgi:competence ComEA-like helix-hairpin-helix protein